MPSRLKLFILWLLVAVGFVLYRSFSPQLVWDDTNWVHVNSTSSGLNAGNAFSRYVLEPFGQLSNAGYRPLNSIIRQLGADFFVGFPGMGMIWFILIGVLQGLSALIIYQYLRQFYSTPGCAGFVLFMYFSSPPIVSSLWIVFAGVQTFVIAIICLGLNIYDNIKKREKDPIPLIVLLALTMILGPWYREFIGILPLLIIACEILAPKKSIAVLVVAVAGLGHAIFPTILMKVFFHSLPANSVFSMGLLGQMVGGGGILLDPFRFQYQFCNLVLNFFSIVPPFLWILSASAIFVTVLAHKYDFKFRNHLKLLLIWFLLSFLPFIKVYTEQVHLAYCLFPALIIMGLLIEKVYLEIQHSKRSRKPVAIIFLVIIGLVVLDGMMNIYGSAKVVAGINNGMMNVASELKKRIPPGAIVIGNALHTGDIQAYSGNYFTAYYSLRAGVPWSQYVVDDKDALIRLANTVAPQEIYFLSADFNFMPDKINYHRHQFVYDKTFPKENLGKIYVAKIQYPYADPLKSFVGRSFISFLGPPDLENDFYRGPCPDGKGKCREVYVEYHLYKYSPL